MKFKRTALAALLLTSISLTAPADDISGPWLEVYHPITLSAASKSTLRAIGPKKNYRTTKTLKSSQLLQTLSRNTITLARQVAGLSFFSNPVILPDGNSILNYGAFGPAKQDVSLYKVTYRSINAQGKPTLLSGLVVVPTDDTGGDASGGIVVYMHATTAQRDNAPSDRSEETYGAITAFGGETQVVAMPDYLGYGVNKLPHPYALGKLNAPSGRDLILATRELMKQFKRTVGPEINISGFSEGGANALWLGRYLEEQGNVALQPVRMAPISGPYDLSGATAQSFIGAQPPASYQENCTSKPSLLSFAGVSTAQLIKAPVNSLLQNALAVQTTGLFPGPIADETVGVRILTTCIDQLNYFDMSSSLSPNPENLLQPSLVIAIKQHDLANPAIRLWSDNDNLNWSPKAPVMLLGVVQDELVPFAATSYPLPQGLHQSDWIASPVCRRQRRKCHHRHAQQGNWTRPGQLGRFQWRDQGGAGGFRGRNHGSCRGLSTQRHAGSQFLPGETAEGFPVIEQPVIRAKEAVWTPRLARYAWLQSV